LKYRPQNVPPPGQNTVNSGVATPSSSAAAATTILKVEPGEYRAWSARLLSGRSRSVLSACHAARSMPVANRFGSYAGRLTSDSTSPVRGSSMTPAPL
jgi:hypothetical protein